MWTANVELADGQCEGCLWKDMIRQDEKDLYLLVSWSHYEAFKTLEVQASSVGYANHFA